MIGCEDRSFKVNETWYFEAVRFLGLDKMVADDYLALCPRHAARYMKANESEGTKEEFTQAYAAGNDMEAITIQVAAAGERLDILLAPNHAIDLMAAVEVDGERDDPPVPRPTSGPPG